MSGDEITLTLPADDAFHRVAELVLSGLAARLDVTLEHIDDLALALETLLRRTNEPVTIRVRVLDDALQTNIGPLAENLRQELDRGGDDSLSLRRILTTTCDRFELADRDDGLWIELMKRIER